MEFGFPDTGDDANGADAKEEEGDAPERYPSEDGGDFEDLGCGDGGAFDEVVWEVDEGDVGHSN